MRSILLKRLSRLWILPFLLSSCGFSKPEPTITPLIPSTAVAVPVQSENYETIDCPFEIPEDMPPEMLGDIQCGRLTVPENRQEPDGKKIQLAVAIVKTTNKTPKPDPVLFLIGDPGYSIALAYGLAYYFKDISAERDMIVIDQRGTGSSDPSINCPGLTTLFQDANANLTLQDANDQLLKATYPCIDIVKTSNADLSKYTTTAVAADIEDLRQALRINQWNIFSFLNGSRLALTMMRDYPQAIRSVIMDSPVPLQANPVAEWGANVQTAFDKLFQRCADDEKCVKAYPNIKDNFYTLLDQLDAKPILVDVADLNSGAHYKVTLDSERLITFLIGILYGGSDNEALPEIPRMVYQLKDGKTEAITRLMGRYYTQNFTAMGQWMDCNEEINFITLEQVHRANQAIDLHLRKYFNTQAEGAFKACEPWKAKGVPAVENQPVESSIPTLLLAGELDWIQPPSWAEMIAQSLRNSTVVEVPGAGQMVYFSSQSSVCSHKIVDAFVETPTTKPDISCVTQPHIIWITLP